MAKAKAGRAVKQQLGQFMTPPDLAKRVVEASNLIWTEDLLVLEPSFGEGAFLVEVIEGLLHAYGSRSKKTLERIFEKQLFGVELDPDLHAKALEMLEAKYGPIRKHNLLNMDFFHAGYMDNFFDIIIGNPPYGGTFDPLIEDGLDRKFGKWKGFNLKKETYSFFIAQSLDLLKDQGRLVFITSDTFLTINTMAGLRHRLMDQSSCRIETLDYFSDETNQPVLVLDATRGAGADHISIEGEIVSRSDMDATANFSWKISKDLMGYFGGSSLGDYLVCTSGMTIGNNELFVKEVFDNKIVEEYSYIFIDEPITLENELAKARLNKLSNTLQSRIRNQEMLGQTRRNVKIEKLKTPVTVELPHTDYVYYNKAMAGIVFKPPKWVVFWKDEGDAVLTFKKNGNWYLHGVGGQKYFGRQGMTWQLVAPKLNMRFLPEGYILDSGAPCGFLRSDIDEEEFWFIFGWTLTEKASEILKTVINHTRNIQSKDVERLPYPDWVTVSRKKEAIKLVRDLVNRGRNGEEFDRDSPELLALEVLYKL